MEFQDVVTKRRMVRTYSDEPVDPAVVERMLANALHSPSAGFSQGWAFLLLDEPVDVQRFWEATTTTAAGNGQPDAAADSWLRGMRSAPVIIVPLSCKAAYLDRYAEPDKGWTDRDETRWPVPYWHIDTGMAALLILQTAVDAGLGACFFGIPPERLDPFRDKFDVPVDHTPIGAITVGHRAATAGGKGSARRGRRPADEVVHRGSW